MTPALLDAQHAADLLGISRRHFQKLDASGRLGPQSIRLGRSVRWSRDELERWAAAGCPPRREWSEQQRQRSGTPVTASTKGRKSRRFVNGAGRVSANLSG